MSATRNVLLLVQYDGTDFHGWQLQASDRTVQGVLHEAVRSMVHHEITLHGSSRTDAGVHARALPVSFETTRPIPVLGFMRGLNGVLPDDVAVVEAREVPAGWRPRRAAVAKTYHYRFQQGPTRQPLVARSSWHLRGALDLAAMRDAAGRLLGYHDFGAFRSTRCDSRSTQRCMHRLDLVESVLAGAPLVTLEITGNAFLRNMVRIVAGTLAAVGLGRQEAASMETLLTSGDRRLAGVTAPARGLTLHEVHFDGYPRLGKK